MKSEHCSLAEYASVVPAGSFDLIVSNPPFFENSLKSARERRSAARHTDSLPLEDLLSDSYRLLSERGRLAVILPSETASAFVVDALQRGFFLHRECRVKSSEEGPVIREMLEVGKSPVKKVATLTLTLGGDKHKKQVAEYISAV
ncbi:MAG: hypothetical protein J6Z27_00280 [Bacteroidales bacterium]|nr:hypothetical protein [Bacteroidales bacterium]